MRKLIIKEKKGIITISGKNIKNKEEIMDLIINGLVGIAVVEKLKMTNLVEIVKQYYKDYLNENE